ncbi:hypothetical protein M2137_000349 [Parabacteroides sp. PFB2-10]|uniref:DUF3408 domain-containing protein n=1 Tax=Parabacteroides sp. PFB2-10 TaxID=1742405 RepID=UPI002474C407|nr:DUF3408 domain-containing protein [Parabacteroides sp. PFB2-10]MDH6311599.1 hypothetical protein [Parabacteroides sp. PFB2-10]
MSSKQTESRKGKVQIPDDFLPTSGFVKTRVTSSENDDLEAEFQKAVEREVAGNDTDIDETIQANETDDTRDSLQTQETESEEPTGSKEIPIPAVTPKRTTSKQRKELLEDYRNTFLSIPKLEDRKPVFISREVRDKIDEIVHRLGGRGRSVSGFIENLARHHLDIYQEDVEQWKKL